MAASPKFKVYDAQGRYQAACKEAECAAAAVGMYGEGATIRYEHGPIVWREGKDGYGSESFDGCAEVVHARVAEIHKRDLVNFSRGGAVGPKCTYPAIALPSPISLGVGTGIS